MWGYFQHLNSVSKSGADQKVVPGIHGYPVEEKPFRSIGIIAALIAMVGYFALVVFGVAGTDG